MNPFKYVFGVMLFIINLAAVGLLILSFLTSTNIIEDGQEFTDGQLFYKHLKLALFLNFICSTLVLLTAFGFKRKVKLKWALWKYFVFNFLFLLLLFLGIYSYIQMRY